jgi:hypothetical protein
MRREGEHQRGFLGRAAVMNSLFLGDVSRSYLNEDRFIIREVLVTPRTCNDPLFSSRPGAHPDAVLITERDDAYGAVPRLCVCVGLVDSRNVYASAPPTGCQLPVLSG